MKLVIESKLGILDKRFLEHLINFLPKIVFTKENVRKLKKINTYLQKNVFNGKRKYSIKQIIMVVLRNIVYQTDNSRAIIQIDPAAVFPFYNMKIKDVANLIDYGNLDIKGTHIFHLMFEIVESKIEEIRNMYEMGLI